MTINSFLSTRKVIILSASFLFFFLACKKEGELNPDFVDNLSAALYTDSVSIFSKTVTGEAFPSDRVATGLLGVYQDSSFGKTTASLYLQPLLPSNALLLSNPGEQIIMDSIILSLQYSSWFGDTTVLQTIDVYELDEGLNINTTYFSDTSINTLPTPLGSKAFLPRPRQGIRINQPNATDGMYTVALNSQVRIRLSDDLGNLIVSKSGGSELQNNENFTKFFKGIKLTPNVQGTLSNNEKAILYFALTASETKMAMFYRVVNTQNDTLNRLLNFPINSSSVRFNTFEYDYSLGAVNSNLQTSENDSLFSYVQAMAGVQTILSFPKLKERFENERVLINKAELVLPVTSGSYAKFGYAQTLTLALKDASGNLQFIPDFFEGEQYFGGNFDASINAYKFNIARYIQGIISGSQKEEGLTVLVAGSVVRAERAVILAPGNEDKKIKLNLFYSKTQ